VVKLVSDSFFGKQSVRKKDSNLKQDDIKSIQFAKIVDLLCHGEIEGIKDGNLDQTYNYQENIFLDDTQIQTTNGRQNFADVSVDFRTGTSNQDPLELIDAVENTVPVSRQVARDPLNTAKTGVIFVNKTGNTTDVLNRNNVDSGYRLDFGNNIELPAETIAFIYASTTHQFKVNEFANIVRLDTASPPQEIDKTRKVPIIQKIGTATKTGDSTSYKYILLQNTGKKYENTNNQGRQTPLQARVATSVGVTATTSSINSTTIDFDKLRVTLQFPDLGESKNDGSSKSFSTSFQIQIIEFNGKTHFPIVNEEVKGIAVRGYTRDYEIQISHLDTFGFFNDPVGSNNDRFYKININENNPSNFQVGDTINFQLLGQGLNKNTQFTAQITGFETEQLKGMTRTFMVTNLKFSDQKIQDKGLTLDNLTTENRKTSFITIVKNILTSFPLQIKVSRNILDETNFKKRNKINFQSFTEIKTETRSYNNFALAGLRFNAEQFGKYPTRKYVVQGTKIKIPAPDVNGRTPEVIRNQKRATQLNLGTIKNFNFIYYPSNYIFNGTLTTTKFFTNDPSWILFDLLTTIKGFGEHIKEKELDLYSFYEASKYSSQLITLPDETKEPRFSNNVILGQKKDAYEVIRDFCSNMNAVPFYSVGSLKLSQDRPTDVSYVFGLANVTEFGFIYNTTSQKTKFTQCTVSYFDNDIQDLQIANVFLKDLHSNLANVENAFGINIKNLKTFGCTSRTQAIRAAKWFLLTQFTRGETVSFSVTVEAGVIVRPGQVIAIQDPLKTNDRTSGRVVSATTDTENDTTVITVDDVEKTNLDSTGTSSLQLTIVLDTDANETDPNLSKQYVETKQILSIDLVQKTITTNAFRRNPLKNTFYVIDRQINNVSSLPKYRVVSISESKQDASYNVSAVLYNELIYSIVESPQEIIVDPIKKVIDLPIPPKNLDAVENIIIQDNRATSVITITWTPVQGVKEYFLEFSIDGGSPRRITTSEINFDIFNSTKGNYEFAIRSINAFGQQSNETTILKKTFSGKTKAPDFVKNLFVETVSDELIKIKFDKSEELDVLHGGFVAYCHDSNTDGSGNFFFDSTKLTFPGNSSEIIVQNLIGKHMLKFIDDGGRASLLASSLIINSSPTSNVQYNEIKKSTTAIVKSIAEHNLSPKFQGFPTNGLVNTEYNSSLDALVISDTSNSNGEGSYLFKEILDLKEVATVQLEKIINAIGFLPDAQWDSRIGDVDEFRTWDSDVNNETFDIDAKLRVQSTNNAPSGASYVVNDFNNCPFIEVTNSTFTGRGFRFVLELKCKNLNQNIKIKQLGCNVKINRRTETSIQTLTTSSVADTVVTFAKPFFAGDASLGVGANLKPHIEVTLLNPNAADVIEITNITNTSFTLNITQPQYQTSRFSRDFTFVAIGYG